MTVTRYRLDPTASTLHVLTFSEGLFARLAHDLRLVVRDVHLVAERDAAGTARVEGAIALASIVVEGIMKDGSLRADVLTERDREEIHAKMRDDVFGGAAPAAELGIRGTLCEGTLEVDVKGPDGRSARARRRIEITPRADGETIHGEVELSLRDLAGRDVKGPLGAFRIADRVRVVFHASFVVDR